VHLPANATVELVVTAEIEPDGDFAAPAGR
jgi:hypothetical protein